MRGYLNFHVIFPRIYCFHKYMQNLIKKLLYGGTWKYRTLSQLHPEDSSKYWPSYVLLDWLDEDTDASS